MSEVTYKVTLPRDFIAESRTRGGITILRDGGYEGPLTAEQREEIEADAYLTIHDGEAESVQKPLTIKEKIAAAEAEGLVLDASNLKTHKEVDAAIEAARSASEDQESEDGDSVVDGIRYTQDGDKVMAVTADTFVNLAESPAGFGATREEALADLQTKNS